MRPDRPNALHDAHHAISLCKELEPYTSAVAEICDQPQSESSIGDSSVTTLRQKALVFDNAAYYYLYNRLLDFLSSRDIVNQQIAEVLSVCQPGRWWWSETPSTGWESHRSTRTRRRWRRKQLTEDWTNTWTSRVRGGDVLLTQGCIMSRFTQLFLIEKFKCAWKDRVWFQFILFLFCTYIY